MTKDALAEGRPVQEVLTEGLIAGMSVVGEDFKHNVLYVPEVLIAARAMKAGMAVLKPLLERQRRQIRAGRRAPDGHGARRSARHRQEPGLHDGRRAPASRFTTSASIKASRNSWPPPISATRRSSA